MPALSRPFTLFKPKDTKTWKVWIRQPDGTRVSRQTHKTSKAAAEIWAMAEITRMKAAEAARIEAEAERERQERNVTFAAYAANFYAWTGNYATDRRSSGKRISERQCLSKQAVVNRVLIPYFGEFLLPDIHAKDIKTFRNSLFLAGAAGSTINHTLCALKPILESAADDELIVGVPRVERAALRTVERGILGPDEIGKLFYEYRWPDTRARVATLLGIACGLRLSEIQALRVSSFDLTSRTIVIEAAWNSTMRYVNPSTKSGKVRIVPVPDRVWDELQALIAKNPYRNELKNPFVFFALPSRNEGGPRYTLPPNQRPVESEIIRFGFYDALLAIGIDRAERQRRKIVFHSTRHVFNSRMVDGGIPGEKIRAVAGHSSISMTAAYYHPGGMDDLRNAQDRLIAPPKIKN